MLIKSYLLIVIAYLVIILAAVAVIVDKTREDTPTPCTQVDAPGYELAPKE
jgi:hypothetical protein